MENIIQDLRMDYGDMSITGLFLVYPMCYVHVLEAWEDIIYKHYELMYSTKNDECEFGRAIPLSSYHHVHQKFFSEWCHVYTIPPTLLETLEGYDLEYIQKQVINCLTKVYILCEYIANTVRQKSINVQDVFLGLGGREVTQYLPESTIFEFLLHVESPVLETVEDRLQIYSDTSLSEFWDDNNVWPPPCSLVPRDVFDERGHRIILFEELQCHLDNEK
ncbi:PREDICTED: uncharacterized protein LOC106749427 [Dinoponera quadriceps]|uniref:Uncharacterized protein LOC106749427 n=1 Tax=Dinoponera quadriceps TaxID=609295 RepID=A0A6P3Y211_DINQU|nr:PREDICTED: uncharacterized protein LOC106749427 [Dinoponera quadriceps]